MPLYEYQCRSCGHRFERIQKFSDPPEKTCPNCGGEVEKLLSSPAIQFKGSGWYITDYARKDSGDKGSKSAPSSSSPSSDSSATASSGAAESKPADSKPADSPAKPAKADKPSS